jgi:diacylglycerol kinase family enzyme
VPRAVLIVNPFASGVTESRVAAVAGELLRVGSVERFLTQRPGHATELVQQACRDGCDAIVILSGDGGFNEAVNGADGTIPLGFIPGGRTSVLPRALGLPTNPVAAARRVADALVAGSVRRISLGRVNGRRFTFSSGVGFDAKIVRRVDTLGRRGDGRRRGDARFALELVREVLEEHGRWDPALELAGLGRAAFALVANGSPYTYAGRCGLRVLPEADFELGLDVLAPVAVRPAGLPRLVRYAFGGAPRGGDEHVLYAHDRDRIEIVCDRPLPLHVDGEDLGDVPRAVFEAERGALAVLG